MNITVEQRQDHRKGGSPAALLKPVDFREEEWGGVTFGLRGA